MFLHFMMTGYLEYTAHASVKFLCPDVLFFCSPHKISNGVFYYIMQDLVIFFSVLTSEKFSTGKKGMNLKVGEWN